ncbi:PREDICTED: ATP-dependent RNA helicase DDX54 [Ceratosolen solmsi marchali]|uniref:RNA helicase n=1 Tax=Ceratosolen solmsi marchali TaxID=326594 RepID=A0AAJ6YT93_9HYME|nr:PREDICTED: ATP-dependent RNA helicase DDX54 [Ceratosolen solmsi marchali]
METELFNFKNSCNNNEKNVFNQINKNNKKKCRKSGGFQAMNLSYPIIKGILKRGYKVPTPIQRKTIPLALEGRDVVAMARTGSGKTACFLIPLFEKLKTRQAKSGARALILAPTRELAIQTLKFIKEIGKFTGLKSSVILGGDSMDDQFLAIHGNPDIIVATPGRFLHICIEMNMNLENIEIVVFDEADRLFEMGLGTQINEILNRLPETRQTLLFSATLPKLLVEFAKAGLENPILVRLDVESKLPDELKLCFITCRSEEKLAVLLCLLKHIVKADTQTVIFVATMHHVEYIHQILDKAGITNTFIYSNLDPSARKINAAKFKSEKVKVLIVTDIAARGIDIPCLDNVINFNFPATSKLFIHRVGRCARAGRSGNAYSIVAPDEYAYLLDLHLFLGRSLNIIPISETENIPEEAIGKIPQSMIEEELSELIMYHKNITDISSMQNVCNNAYQQYIRSRPPASTESNKRIKELHISIAGILPEFRNSNNDAAELISKIKSYKPRGTIFEIVAKPSSVDYKIMKEKRKFHKENIINYHQKIEEVSTKNLNYKAKSLQLSPSSIDEINDTFSQVITSKKRKIYDICQNKHKKKQKVLKDDQFYVPYTAPDRHTEQGLAVNNFTTEADKVYLDFTADNENSRRFQNQIKKWDRKKKKMITIENNPKAGKIQTESGTWIPSTYKTKRYLQWKEKNKIGIIQNDDNTDNEVSLQMQKLETSAKTHWARHNQKLKEKIRIKSELKTPDQILKARKILERKKQRNGRKKKGGRSNR